MYAVDKSSDIFENILGDTSLTMNIIHALDIGMS